MVVAYMVVVDLSIIQLWAVIAYISSSSQSFCPSVRPSVSLSLSLSLSTCQRLGLISVHHSNQSHRRLTTAGFRR